MVTVKQLIGRQRAEFDRAALLFRGRFTLLVSTAVMGAISTAVSAPYWLYVIAFLALVLALVMLLVDDMYQSSRLTAERARRATLVMHGLGRIISETEINDIHESMSASDKKAKALEDADYYASKSHPGPQKLLEMIEEAAFWTKATQRVSGLWAWGFFFVAVLVSVVTFFFIVPSWGTNDLMTAARVLCAVLIFAVGTDFLGAARTYQSTAQLLDRLLLRIDGVRLRGYPEVDVLTMFGDYNGIVERTPLTLPLVYKIHKAELNRMWSSRKTIGQ